jgi:nitroreductase
MDTKNYNEVIAAILERRSIRKYVPGQQISDDDLHIILQAGFNAPTAANKHPVHLFVIKDRNLLNDFSVAKGEAEMISKASLAIVVCGDANIQSYNDFLHEDCAAAVQNMLLCIHSLGLGAVWCGVPSILNDCYQTYKEKLGLPENIVPIATVAVGYPNESKKPNDRFDETKLHYEHW